MSYKIVEELGRGGMGVVYRALHPELNREVAIKFLIDDAGQIGDVTRQRFRREMEVLMKLSHPSIIKVYDAGEADGRLYYVMELLRARDLHWHLRKRGRLPIAVALSVLDQMLDALEYIHESGIVHRDIKPSNIVLEDTGRAILMDFGVVRKSGATLLTQEGHAIGTPRYFSPEMIMKGESSPASDQFSLGVVAYELLTATPPFGGNSLPEVAAAIMRHEPVAIPEQRAEVPAAVAAVITRMMAKKPEDRWPSMGAAREALAAAQVGPGEAVKLGESAIVPLPPMPSTARPTGKRSVAVEPRLLVTQESMARDAASRRLRNGLGICAGIALAIVLPLTRFIIRSKSVTPPATTTGAVPRASDVVVRRTALDTLRVEFTTGTASRWALDRGRGAEAQEKSDITSHAIELKTSPWQPEDSLALVSAPHRVELLPPPSVSELVHRFRATTRASQFAPAAVELLWSGVREDLVKTVKHINSRTFRAAIANAPATRKRFNDHVERLKRTRGLAETLRGLAPHVAPLLMSAETPPSLRNELLEALWAIDRTDALASWLALPSPFGVQRMLAPAIEIAADLSGDQPASDARRHSLEMSPDRNGFVLVLANEVPTSGTGLMSLSDTMLLMRGATKGRKHGPEASFSNADAPPAEVRRFLFELQALDANIYLALKPPGFDVALPIRPPDCVAPPPSDTIWLTLTLRGALVAVRGTWTFQQTRAFEEHTRIYVVVDRVLEEELPAR